jgi:DNA repair/transcription protein MET18/MMS19
VLALTRAGHCLMGSGLHKQRLFASTLQPLGKLVGDLSPVPSADATSDVSQRIIAEGKATPAAPSRAELVLLAVAYQMVAVPKAVLVAHVEAVLPLLLRGLLAQHGPLRLLMLSSAASLLDQPAAVVAMSGHVATLITTFLELATQSSCEPSGVSLAGGPKIRLSALKCLQALTALPFHALFPHRTAVLNGLQVALDDPRRVVRKAAVYCRNKWFQLEGDSGDGLTNRAAGSVVP